MEPQRVTVVDPIARQASYGFPDLQLQRWVELLHDDLKSLIEQAHHAGKPLTDFEVFVYVDTYYKGFRKHTQEYCYKDNRPDWSVVDVLATKGYVVWVDQPTQQFMIKLEGHNLRL